MPGTSPVNSSNQQHPLIPRVQCPQCGMIMRLARIEPERDESHSSRMMFDCECEYVYQQTERARAGG
jgi:hypothetical protein